uniref:Uncharacterized protein n=1 Tax=Rhizophora mucronata TaxID=61149 RepID=A0A2P2PTF3_RHIMU
MYPLTFYFTFLPFSLCPPCLFPIRFPDKVCCHQSAGSF